MKKSNTALDISYFGLLASGDSLVDVKCSDVNRVCTDSFVETSVTSIPARVALVTFFNVALHCSNFLGTSSWIFVWHGLGLLRDCALLPKAMVVESDFEILPPAARAELENRIVKEESKSGLIDRSLFHKKSPSLLSLQSLGEAIFGPSPLTEHDNSSQDGNNMTSSKWDAGYEHDCSSDVTTDARDQSGQEKLGRDSVGFEFAIPQIIFHDCLLDTSGSGDHNFGVVEIMFQQLR